MSIFNEMEAASINGTYGGQEIFFFFLSISFESRAEFLTLFDSYPV